ncbi:hypothetical protein PIB30_083352 [Stylosanthes scabra]|uniref:Uncharacterized protein n=1 Tax=Stylosanthes scabra TaxID=79078 RepID=A0ABU6USD6_9FABA|nr:hypothetical protein [Stylosanthes scabra]
MPDVKQTGRRTRMDPNVLPMPPRLSQLPEERWFEDDNERLVYDECLSKMEIFPPKFIRDGVLPDEKYPEIWRLIDNQGLRPFLYMRERSWESILCSRNPLFLEKWLRESTPLQKRRGRNKLRVAANGASIEALDQKLPRSKIADE